MDGLIPLAYSLELRQDFFKYSFAWVARLAMAGIKQDYFVDEKQEFDFGLEKSIYLETALRWDIGAKLTLSEPGRREFVKRREFFALSRAGMPTGCEVTRHDRGPDVTLTIAR